MWNELKGKKQWGMEEQQKFLNKSWSCSIVWTEQVERRPPWPPGWESKELTPYYILWQSSEQQCGHSDNENTKQTLKITSKADTQKQTGTLIRMLGDNKDIRPPPPSLWTSCQIIKIYHLRRKCWGKKTEVSSFLEKEMRMLIWEIWKEELGVVWEE